MPFPPPAERSCALVGGGCNDPQDLRFIGSWIPVPVRESALERKAIPPFEHITLILHPELEPALEYDDAFLVGIVSVGLITGSLSRGDDAQDHLQALRRLRRQKVVVPAVLRVCETETIGGSHDASVPLPALEQSTDRDTQRVGDPTQRRYAGIRHATFHLRDETLGNQRLGGQLLEGQ